MSRPLAPSDVERFRNALAALSGFDLQQQKTEPLHDLLANRIRQTRSDGVEPYLQRLTSVSTSADELRVLAKELTVNETYFFREAAHLAAFVEHAVPALVGNPGEPSARALRILSAGSSSGEEAYTLAMLLQEHRPDLVAKGSAVVGCDLTPGVVEKARRGRYTDWSLRQTSAEHQARYFHKDGGEHVLAPAIRSMVTFEQRNLLDEDAVFWRPGAFDVIFCRNVFIYFSPDAVAAVVARFQRALTPGGFLFLGSAETLRGVTDRFELVSARETFFYQAGKGTTDTTPIRAARPSAPVQPEIDDGWMDAIRASSARLQTLAAIPCPAPSAATVDAPVAFDLDATLELFRRERFDEALARFPATGKLSARARVLRAVILVNRGEAEAAERLCRDLLARNELSAEAHYLLAYGQEQAGDTSAAGYHDRTAAELDSTFAMPRFHLGNLARRSGDLSQARQDLTHAHALLAYETDERITLFAGGFTRTGLRQLCLSALHACGGNL